MATATDLIPFFDGMGYGPEPDDDVEQVLAGAGLMADVELVPVYAKFGDGLHKVPGRVATQRQSDGRVLGVVTPRYEVVQNRDAFSWVQEMVDNGVASYHKAGDLKGGSLTYLLAKLNRQVQIGGFESETIETYMLVANSFDASASLLGRFIPMRLVCSNGLLASIPDVSREFRIRHVNGAGDKLAEAERVMALAADYLGAFETLGNDLVSKKMTAAQFQKLLERLIPLPIDANPDKDRSARNKLEARETIKAIFQNDENLANVRGTKWAAYNAVAQYADHNRRVRGTGESPEDSRMENRFIAVTSDTKLKDQALALLA